MAFTLLDNLNLGGNEIQNAVAQNLASAPDSPQEGRFFYDSTSGLKSFKFWNGSEWVVVDPRKLTNAIPLAALTNIANGTFLGNRSGSAGAPTAMTVTQAKTLLAIAPGDVSGFDTQVRTSRLDQMAAPTAAVAFNGQRATGLADPSSAQDAATKAYVDSQAQSGSSGLDPKDAVVAATTANITLSGTQTVDGVALSSGDRVLVKSQTDASQNGIYEVASGAWSRATDAGAGKLTNGALVLATDGDTNAGTQWYLQTADPITVGTTDLTFTQFGAGGTYTADASGGLELTGSAFGVKLPAASGLKTDANGLAVDTNVMARKYATDVGDGSSTSIVVTHNLNTRDVHVTLRAAASPYDIQYASVQCTSANTVTLQFAEAPDANALRATVIG